MRFRHELAYDAPPQRVFAMLADPGFRRAVGEAQDVVSMDVEVEGSGTGLRITIDQVQRTTDLPSFARTFAGDTTQAVQREVWSGPDAADVTIEAPGKPTNVSGTIRLEADGEGTREVVELEVKVKVPLVGGKLERLMVDKMATGMDMEHTVGVRWLEERRWRRS